MNKPVRYTFILLLGLSITLVLLRVPAHADRVTVQAATIGPFIADGETAQLRNFFGFHEPERIAGTDPHFFRWTTGQGNFVIRNGARLGATLLLEVRLCGCRAESVAPPNVVFAINGEALLRTAATPSWNSWRRYQMLVPANTPSYTPDILVALTSDVLPNTRREGKPLGVAFEQATLRSITASPPVYTRLTAWGLGLVITGFALLFGRSGAQILGIFGASLVLVVGQGWLYRLHQLPPEVFAWGLLFGFGMAFLLTATIRARVVLTGLYCLPIALIQLLGAWLVDDAFISFRYAHNVVHGYGLVFNASERVEGFTNFLWTVLFVPIVASTIPPGLASLAVTLFLTQITLALVWCGACTLVAPRFAVVALGLLLVSPSFIAWSGRGSGMETALFCALLAAASALYLTHVLKKSINTCWVGVLLACAALTRPEGVLVAVLTVLFHCVLAYRSERRVWYEAGGLALGFMLLFIPYYVWRFTYYGYPLPNTFYAKVGGTTAQVERGLRYAFHFTTQEWPLVLLAAFAVGLCVWLRVKKGDISAKMTHAVVWMGLFVSSYTGYIITVGGDHFPFSRFFIPLMPLFALLAAVFVAQCSALFPRWAAMFSVVLIALIAIVWQTPRLYASRTLNTAGPIYVENQTVERNREAGLWFCRNTQPDTLIATAVAGAMPYYAQRPVLDVLGLNDLHIAHLDLPSIGSGEAGHEKHDSIYVVNRKPAFIMYNTAPYLYNDPSFKAAYQLHTFDGPEGASVRIYVRRELVPVLQASAPPRFVCR